MQQMNQSPQVEVKKKASLTLPQQYARVRKLFNFSSGFRRMIPNQFHRSCRIWAILPRGAVRTAGLTESLSLTFARPTPPRFLDTVLSSVHENIRNLQSIIRPFINVKLTILRTGFGCQGQEDSGRESEICPEVQLSAHFSVHSEFPLHDSKFQLAFDFISQHLQAPHI